LLFECMHARSPCMSIGQLGDFVNSWFAPDKHVLLIGFI
jgi:hypothetical protein